MRIVQLLVLGLSLGAVYGLIALGFVAIYRGTKVINLAHGSMLLLGAFVTASLADDLGFAAALLSGIVAAALCAVAIERIVSLAPTGDHLVLTILTVGVDIALFTELTRRMGVDVVAMGDPWGDSRVALFGTTLPTARIAAGIACLLVIGAYFVVLRRTDFGIRMRAAAEDPETASLVGISQRRVSMTSWAIGGGLACLAGVSLALFPNPGLDSTVHLLALNAIPAVMIGGLDSSLGAVVGGVIVGVTQSLVQGNAETFRFLGEGFADVAPYAVMLLVLLVRPTGLFGSRELTRV